MNVTKEYIQQLLNRISDTDIDKSKFGPFYNLMLLPTAQISVPVEYRLRQLEDFQGLSNPQSLNEREVDIVASNHLVFRRDGEVGTANVKAVVRIPKDLNIPSGTTFFIDYDGDRFEFKNEGFSFRDADFTVSPTYDGYYVSPTFQVTTSKTDENYNFIPADSILSSSLTDTNVVYFIMESITSQVIGKETNVELYLRLLNTIGSKSLNTEAGAINLFSEFYPQVPIVAIFGNADTEVTRDTIGFFVPSLNEEWDVLSFKGKDVANNAIPHMAYEFLLTVSGIEYDVTDDTVIPDGLDDFILYEASQSDYEALYLKLSEAYFESGHNIFLAADTFTTDEEWELYDAYLGLEGELHTPNEITISGLFYILGCDLEYIDYAAFIRDILNSNPPEPDPPPPPPIGGGIQQVQVID